MYKLNPSVNIGFFKENIVCLLKSFKLYFILMLFIIAGIYSTIIPPFHSDDEYEHLTRAYLLAKGQILLDSPKDGVAGGYIDDGLIHYMGILPHGKSISRSVIHDMGLIRWTGTESYYAAPGTGYYFPAIYIPQAMALLTGQILDLSIDHSYRLERFFAFTASLMLIIIAFKIFPTNFLILGLLIIPSSIFQIVAPTIDGMTFALTILSLSIFMRGANIQNSFPTWMPIVLTFSLFILINCRNQLIPLAFLPLFIYFIRKDKSNLWLFLLLISLTLIWIFIAITHSDVGMRRSYRGFSSSDFFIYYIFHPLDFFKLFFATLGDAPSMEMYAKKFVGGLGRLDTATGIAPFKNTFYSYAAAFLFLMSIFSISYSTIRSDYAARLLLIFLSMLSIFLIFFSMLIAYSSPNSTIIEGVQGRYFIPVAIILAFALSGNDNVFKYPQLCFAIPLIFLWGIFVSVAFTDVLLIGCYLQ